MSWQQAPFIRLLLPLILGVLLSLYVNNALIWVVLGIIIIGLPIVVFWGLGTRQKIQQLRFGAIVLNLFLVAFGYGLTYLHNELNQPAHFEQHITTESNFFIATIKAPPKLSAKSLRTILDVEYIHDSTGVVKSSVGQLLCYIKLDTASVGLELGDRLLCHGRIELMKGPRNPHAFNAKQYYSYQNIHYQTYLASQHWEHVGQQESWNSWIENARNYLLETLKKHIPTPNEYAVAAALILGAKGDLDKEVKNAYAETGATHVLAVSGLHVGIISVLFAWILGLIPIRKKWWIYVRTAIQLLLIWLFALLTGASPSVLRASTMFSFLVVGQALNRNSSIYNTLAASAFLLICLNPYIIMNIGFQLSYIAVLGIVYLQPKIYRKWYISNKWGDKAWSLLSVSLAAQIATLPIGLYYFHQFPVYFWLSGFVVIPAATMILSLGLALLVFSWVPVVGTGIAYLLNWVLWLMNAAVFGIQVLPAAVWTGFWLESWEMILWYLVLASGLWALYAKRLKILYLPACLVLLIVGVRALDLWKLEQQESVWIYHSPKGSLIDVINNREAISIADSTLLKTQLYYTHQANLWANKIRNHSYLKTYIGEENSSFLWLNKDVLQVSDKRFLLYNSNLLNKQTHQPLTVDYVVVHQNPKLKHVEELYNVCAFDTLIFDATNPYWAINKWKTQCENLGIGYIDIRETGAKQILLD
ncbi:MAG: ComEC family competence protein [Aureispira sp.]|nr:ComEC family competence protein [Aureispira sp.]